jgi:hypothetical protein
VPVNFKPDEDRSHSKIIFHMNARPHTQKVDVAQWDRTWYINIKERCTQGKAQF